MHPFLQILPRQTGKFIFTAQQMLITRHIPALVSVRPT